SLSHNGRPNQSLTREARQSRAPHPVRGAGRPRRLAAPHLVVPLPPAPRRRAARRAPPRLARLAPARGGPRPPHPVAVGERHPRRRALLALAAAPHLPGEPPRPSPLGADRSAGRPRVVLREPRGL